MEFFNKSSFYYYSDILFKPNYALDPFILITNNDVDYAILTKNKYKVVNFDRTINDRNNYILVNFNYGGIKKIITMIDWADKSNIAALLFYSLNTLFVDDAGSDLFSATPITIESLDDVSNSESLVLYEYNPKLTSEDNFKLVYQLLINGPTHITSTLYNTLFDYFNFLQQTRPPFIVNNSQSTDDVYDFLNDKIEFRNMYNVPLLR